jgi:hypothetical protein
MALCGLIPDKLRERSDRSRSRSRSKAPWCSNVPVTASRLTDRSMMPKSQHRTRASASSHHRPSTRRSRGTGSGRLSSSPSPRPESIPDHTTVDFVLDPARVSNTQEPLTPRSRRNRDRILVWQYKNHCDCTIEEATAALVRQGLIQPPPPAADATIGIEWSATHNIQAEARNSRCKKLKDKRNVGLRDSSIDLKTKRLEGAAIYRTHAPSKKGRGAGAPSSRTKMKSTANGSVRSANPRIPTVQIVASNTVAIAQYSSWLSGSGIRSDPCSCAFTCCSSVTIFKSPGFTVRGPHFTSVSAPHYIEFGTRVGRPHADLRFPRHRKDRRLPGSRCAHCSSQYPSTCDRAHQSPSSTR